MSEPPVFIWTRREFDARRLHAFVLRYQRDHGWAPTLREMQAYLVPDNVGCGGNGRITSVVSEAANLGLLVRVGGPGQARSIVPVEIKQRRASA